MTIPSQPSKKNLFSVHYSLTDYKDSTAIIISKAINNESYGVSALAVHGLIESIWDRELNRQVNKIDMVVPDGQPIRWALNYFYKAQLKDRVYGPKLVLSVLEKANELGLKIYLYGSTELTLSKLRKYINKKFPQISVCGQHSDRFRDATPQEDILDIDKINDAGAQIVLVGRGCPRQEKWVANHIGKVNAPMLAVGAAFDFLAGNVSQAPSWMQKNGLEWLFRLIKEPGRLWKRYLFTNTYFVLLCIMHCLKPSLLEKQ